MLPIDLSQKTEHPLKLFFSYPHQQGDICRDIYEAISRRGHDVWIDEEQLNSVHGMDWRQKITEGIRDSQAILSCINAYAIRNENGRRGVCLDELSIAVGVKGGNIITVLLESEDRVTPNAAISHRQRLDMSEWQEKKKQGSEIYSLWLTEKLQEIICMIESPDNYEFDGEIKQILEKLDMSEFRLGKEELLTRSFVGREWLAEQIEQWLNDGFGSRMCAIYGDPGIGKSAFAVQYAFSHCDRVATILCFEHGNNVFNSPETMIHVIAFQLACRLPDYRKELCITLGRQKIQTLKGVELFDALLTNLLGARHHIDGSHETLCIIIDGLDECTVGETNTVSEVLRNCVERLPPWLRVLVTSRRDAAVQNRIMPGKTIELIGNTVENLSDVQLYFESNLKQIITDDKTLQNTISKLMERCGGSFLYAYLAVRGIREGIFDVNNPESFPPNLSANLFSWFQRFFPDIADYDRRFRLPVGAILASPEPLPLEELEGLLNLTETEVRDLVRRMKVVLKRTKTVFSRQAVGFDHKYVQDWILSEDAGPYCVSEKDSANALALAMCNKLQTDPENLTGYETLNILNITRRAGLTKMLRTVESSLPLAEVSRRYGLELKEAGKHAISERLIYQSIMLQINQWIIHSQPGELCCIVGKAGIGKTAFVRAYANEMRHYVHYISLLQHGLDEVREMIRRFGDEVGSNGKSKSVGVLIDEASDHDISEIMRVCPDRVRIISVSRSIHSWHVKHMINVDALFSLSKTEIMAMLSERTQIANTLATFTERITDGNRLLTDLLIRLYEISDYDPISILRIYLTQAQHQEQEIKNYRQAQRFYEGGLIIAETLSEVADDEMKEAIGTIVKSMKEGIERCLKIN